MTPNQLAAAYKLYARLNNRAMLDRVEAVLDARNYMDATPENPYAYLELAHAIKTLVAAMSPAHKAEVFSHE